MGKKDNIRWSDLELCEEEVVYSIAVPKEAFAKSLIRVDSVGGLALYEHLTKIPSVRDCNYDGMFGPFIFVRMNKSHENLEVDRIQVLKKIAWYLNQTQDED